MKKRLLEICCLCAALFIFYEHFPGIWYGSKSRNWIKTSGRIENICIAERGRNTFSLIISYSYDIEGKTYAGDKIHAEQRNSFFPKQGENLYDKYKSTPEILVFYDPSAKSRACLIPGYVKIDYYAQTLLGIFFLISSIYSFLQKERLKDSTDITQ